MVSWWMSFYILFWYVLFLPFEQTFGGDHNSVSWTPFLHPWHLTEVSPPKKWQKQIPPKPSRSDIHWLFFVKVPISVVLQVAILRPCQAVWMCLKHKAENRRRWGKGWNTYSWKWESACVVVFTLFFSGGRGERSTPFWNLVHIITG